ncbi:MAG: lamin tail domain-containing protein [Patescibacteria group bacterium]|nr:lamin tail domain-containing protein [Patescibacteria group bacterium]
MFKTVLSIILGGTAFFICAQSSFAASQLDISVIEIATFEKSGYEWIKIHNNSNSDIDLEAWKFVEGFSDSKPEGVKHSIKEHNNGYIISPQSSAIICQTPEKFLEIYKDYSGMIIDSSWSSLKEAGERIQLLDADKNIIEDFTYLKCSNAVLKRKIFDSPDYTSNNWYEESGADSKTEEENKSQNSSSENNNQTSSDKKTSIKSIIIINELFPNPENTDSQNEFIELKNIGKKTISLNNWKINDNSKRTYTINNNDFSSLLIRPNQFFVIYRKTSKIALNNFGGDKIKLYDLNGNLADEISYKEKANENQSYSRNEKNEWLWTDDFTPGKKNIVGEKNEKPIIAIDAIKEAIVGEQIIFDASDSYDIDGDDLFFIWNFKDGGSSTLPSPVYAYQNSGKYKIKLSVFDSRDAFTEKSFYVNINPETSDNNYSNKTENNECSEIIISEIFPNPKGKDDNEFIELFNPTAKPVDLSDWILDDNSKSSGWTIPEQTIIKEKEFLCFYKQDTHISLNNNYDSVFLINPREEIIAEISYEQTIENQTYAFDPVDENWYWTPSITPNSKNEFIEFYDSYEYNSILPATNNNLKNGIKKVSIEEIQNCQLKSLIQTTGIVAVEPGILGKQIFYLDGIQVYKYDKDFPELKSGDEITLTGELTKSREELRIKIKNKKDIIVIEDKKNAEALEINIEEIEEQFMGRLVLVSGEIMEQKSNSLWIDDNTEEIKIYINKYTGIELEKEIIGREAEIIGIVSKTTSGLRLLPRYQSDIKLGKILGKIASAQEIDFTNNEQSNFFIEKKYYKYIFVTIAGFLIIIGNLIWRKRKKI